MNLSSTKLHIACYSSKWRISLRVWKNCWCVSQSERYFMPCLKFDSLITVLCLLLATFHPKQIITCKCEASRTLYRNVPTGGGKSIPQELVWFYRQSLGLSGRNVASISSRFMCT